MSSGLKDRATALQRAGYTVREIAERLNISASTSARLVVGTRRPYASEITVTNPPLIPKNFVNTRSEQWYGPFERIRDWKATGIRWCIKLDPDYREWIPFFQEKLESRARGKRVSPPLVYYRKGMNWIELFIEDED